MRLSLCSLSCGTNAASVVPRAPWCDASARSFQRTYKNASTSRKLFRMLKWLKEYQAAIDSMKTEVRLHPCTLSL